MSTKRTAVRCPDCDIELNYHGDRIIQPRTPEEARLYDDELGGVVIERHCCPECGESSEPEA